MARNGVVPQSVAIIALLAMALSTEPAAGAGEAVKPDEYRWPAVLESFGQDRDRMRRRLRVVMGVLRGRLAHDHPELLARLHMGPPLRHGYGVLPRVDASAPLAGVRLKRSVYSLAAWKGAVPRLNRDIRALGRPAAVGAEGGETPEKLVARFEGLRKRVRIFEKNLKYHAYWQQAVIDYPHFFARKKQVAVLAERLKALDGDHGRSAEAAKLRARIVDRVVRFARTPGLALRTDPPGGRVLAVTLVTDIVDEAFLDRFRDGVAQAYTRSPAARDRRFEVRLDITVIPPAALYPGGVPETGAEIDLAAHLARFPDGALILTTGAESTHAFTGRYVALGPSPLTPRVLAHEFGHLLGFSDTYVRSYTGAPGDAHGVVVIEWSGLHDDLMGSPGSGRVGGRMIDTLIENYGARREAP